MSVPAIALYAGPPSTVCSTSHYSASDFDLNPNPRPPLCSSTSPPPSSSSCPGQKPISGGLSCLFSCHSAPDEVNSLFYDHRSHDDLSSSLSYASYSYSSSSFKSRDHSPISVLHGPVAAAAASSSSRSPLLGWSRMLHSWGKDRMFKGFVRNALGGSCLDYDSQSFSGIGGGRVEVAEELTFDLEEVTDCEPYAAELLLKVQLKHKIFYEELVVKAFYEAEKVHKGQMRASGDPYLLHCVETAELLAKIGVDATVVAAGLLHDALDASFMNYDYIFQMFGAGVADLVGEVSKLSQLSKLVRDNNTASKTVEADRLHMMFLAMEDPRAVLIKLADRLHNMMTLEALPVAKQQKFAKETFEIFAPLANRLGISTWKEQLDNLCFKHLHPEKHKELSSKLVKSFDEEIISSAIGKLEQALKEEGVSYHFLCGRHKSLYSIYSKMQKKKLTMDEIHDIHGVRLIVEKEKDCYTALSVVHRLWPKVPGRHKDYILHPKFNGYQSIHTVVLGEDMLPLEVQIRTKEMHLQAEFGFASHWRYKEGDCKHSSSEIQMVEWARWVVTWLCETVNSEGPLTVGDAESIRPPCPFPSHTSDCPHFTRQCNHDGPIFIITLESEKMLVQEFPPNSTVKDLLERAGRSSARWTAYSFPSKEDLRPRLNHEPVNDPNQKLKMGDVIELTPSIPDKSLTEYREEIQRMYDHGLTATVPGQSERKHR